ncbi:MAG: LUD domain-containing protein, partial [Desulfonatronovibrionaceae bacterium]
MLSSDNLKDYQSEIEKALQNDFQRRTLDTFAVAYRTGRANAFAGMDIPALVKEIARSKDDSLARMDELYQEFKEKAEALGVHVHLAADAAEANGIIAEIASRNKCRSVVKSKSMTAEEIHLNTALEKQGLRIVETDLGEWIIQLRKEPPSHMVLPAI